MACADFRAVTDGTAAGGTSLVPVQARRRDSSRSGGRADSARAALAAAEGWPRVSLGAALETKFQAPATRSEWVERGELVGALAGITVRLVLVGAPAGSGKTTLVAQWRSSPAERRQFAWISLDPGDNDSARLCGHLVYALARACPELNFDDILPALQAKVPDLAGTVLPLLLNELASLAEPVVVVLDDYHVITDPGCNDLVAFLVLHLPAAVELVMITRADPSMPLARLRAAGDLVEVRERELRLTPAQVAELIKRVAAIELREADLADLMDRTEGWPAGVYLAALALRGHQSPGRFIRQFTGEARFVAAFLTEEVLSNQPANIRRFLARTSIMSRFCAPLCYAVTGSSDAAGIIDVLERENLFVVPLDDARQWFRYHHLFAQVLRSELTRTEPEMVATLHQRASDWLGQSGLADEAITHARAAVDMPRVISLIAQNWHAYVCSGRSAAVRAWLSSLGDAAVTAHPVAAHCWAWTAALSGDRESLRRWLPIIETGVHDGPLPDGVRSLQSSAALLKGTFGLDGIGPMRDAAAQAIRLEADPASPWHALAMVTYAAALYWSGDLGAAAVQARAAASAAASIAGIRMLGFALLALIAADQDRLEEAEELARTAREMVPDAEHELGAAPQSTLAHTAVGAVCAARGRLTEARWEFERALGIRRSLPAASPWPTLEILVRLAPVLSALGDRPGATGLADQARLLLASAPDGADAQFARLDQLERQLAGPLPGLRSRGPLTEREVTVLRLLRGTLSVREIGEQLCLSQNTIKTHVSAIYRKLGVSTRQDAIAQGQDTGIL